MMNISNRFNKAQRLKFKTKSLFIKGQLSKAYKYSHDSSEIIKA